MEKVECLDCETIFQFCMDENFPKDGKRTKSAVIRSLFARRIVDHLKGRCDDDKGFCYFVKKSSFELLDLPAVGIRDALVVRLKQEKKVCVSASTWHGTIGVKINIAM